MALAACSSAVTDAAGRELAVHGTARFPIACYLDDLDADSVYWHWHEEWEALVVVQGAAIVAAGSEKVTLRAGQGCFFNAGVLHAAWGVPGTACRFHSLVFHPRLVGGGLDSVFWQDYVVPLQESPALRAVWLDGTAPWHAAAEAAVDAAWQACVQEPAGYVFTVRAALSRLTQLLLENHPQPRRPVPERTLREGARIKTMLQYVQAHFAEPLTTAAIAQSAAVSESECLRCFRHTIGVPPLQYVRQLRLQTAARLLLTTDRRSGDIGAQCGFADTSYFTKTFRQWKGCAPGAYRARHAAAGASG